MIIMKNLSKHKLLIGVGVIGLLILLLAASGVLKFKVTRTDQMREETPTPTSGSRQKQELMSKTTTFKGAGGAIMLGINLPVGWRLGSDERLDLVAGSQLAEKLENGTGFTVNLNVGSELHSKKGTSFADYVANYKDLFLGNNPSLEEVTNYSTKADGVDIFVMEVKNTLPSGLVLRQFQYLYYLNDDYYAISTASIPEEVLEKYSGVVGESLRSLRLVEVIK